MGGGDLKCFQHSLEDIEGDVPPDHPSPSTTSKIFDFHGIVYLHWVSEGQTRSLPKSMKKIRIKPPELFDNKLWVLQQDNAPTHSALSVKISLAKYIIPVLDHPPHSPDLAPCDFYLFLKLKPPLKGFKLLAVEAMNKKPGVHHEGACWRRLPALFQTMENLHGVL